MLDLVPSPVVGDRAQAERRAQVHAAYAGVQDLRHRCHRDFKRCGQEDGVDSLVPQRIDLKGHARGCLANRQLQIRDLPVLEQNRVDARMTLQDAQQLRAAVAREPNDTDP